MQKLFVPFLFDDSTFVKKGNGLVQLFSDSIVGYPTKEAAVEAGKQMAMGNPKGKVVVLESLLLIEPRKIEFAEKMYTSNGELIA